MAAIQFEVTTAGVTFEKRQEILRALHARQKGGSGLIVQLQREPSNKYDPNAIKVLVDGFHVGYIPRVLAARLSGCLLAGAVAKPERPKVLLGGEPGRQGYGFRFDLMVDGEDSTLAPLYLASSHVAG